MNKARMILIKYLFFACLVSITLGCTTYIPYVREPDPVTSEFDVHVIFTNLSDDEYAFIRNKTETGRGYKIHSSEHKGDRFLIVYKISSLAIIDKLLFDLDNLKAMYDGQSDLTNILKRTSGFTQYNMTGLGMLKVDTSAQYLITVIFDPHSEVSIGGYVTKTDENGKAIFNGMKLDLSMAETGDIFIIDNVGNKVRVVQGENSHWYVKAVGYSLGKTAEKLIEVEALK